MDSIMGENTRGASQSRPLLLLAALMGGETLTRDTGASMLSVKHEGAYRLLRLLEQHIPGVKARNTSPVEFWFDASANHIPMRPQVVRAGFASAMAATFGSAFAKVFSGTSYAEELRHQRDTVIATLATKRQVLFENIGRKVHVVSGQEELLTEQSGLLDDVLDAVLRQHTVTMTYQRFNGRVNTMEVRLFSLAVYDSRLYVVGNGPQSTYYPYRFARILSVESTGKRFEYPSISAYDPSQVFRHSIGIFVDPDPCDICVRLNPSWKTYALHHRWHDSQQVTEQEDGSVLLKLHVRPCGELEQWVLRFGENAEVLAPEDLRIRIARRLAAAAKLYAV